MAWIQGHRVLSIYGVVRTLRRVDRDGCSHSWYLLLIIPLGLRASASKRYTTMGSLAMSLASLQFGIEIELLLGGRKKAHSSWKSLASDLSKRLAAAGIANHINEGGDKAVEHYREWSIVREVTIPSQPAKGLCKLSFWTFFPIPEALLYSRRLVLIRLCCPCKKQGV